MLHFPLLSVMTFLPLLGAGLILVLRGNTENMARGIALAISLGTLLAALYMIVVFNSMQSGFQFTENLPWIPALHMSYLMGVDGISVFFVLLAALLTPVCILASWRSISTHVRSYMVAFLVLESFMIGSFCALNTLLFYVFFEGVLIPMFFIIGVWGGKNRVHAAYKFFLYTLAGSVLLLIALLALAGMEGGGTSLVDLLAAPPSLSVGVQLALFAAFFASFAVKLPLWPFHTWLPDAHVEAPTAGSVILAGVLLKMGGYGFLRFCLPLVPEASAIVAPLMMTLGAIAIVYTSAIALVQQDMKKLIAYSSVAHMGFVIMGMFSFTHQGIEGAVFQMISHGLISAALFLSVGVLYDRAHTREIGRYGGIVANMPRFAFVFMIFTLGSMGLPATSGFVGEFLSLLGAFKAAPYLAAFGGLGLILGAAYMLRLYGGLFFGARDNADAAQMPDIAWRESLLLFPLAAAVVILGLVPTLITRITGPAVTHMLGGF